MNKHISNVFCDNCGTETRDDAYLCDDCCDKAARAIGEVPWLDDELDITLAKIKAAGDAGPASAETALPLNLAASAKRATLRHALVMAVRFCDEEGVRHRCPNNDLPQDNIQAMSRWMLWRIDGLALNDMGPQVIADVVSAIRAAKRVIDKPPERSYAGPCPECKRDLYHRPDAVQVSCSGCGQRWNVGEVKAWMQRRLDLHLADRLVTTAEAKTLLGRYGLGMDTKTIEKWIERGRLTAHGEKPRMFRWDDVRVLAAQHHATNRSA